MAFQEFELNMIPHGDMPTFYASQYETGRPIIIDIMMGEDAFDCSELYIELHARKVDDNIVTLEPDSVDGNQVTFVGTDQLFACPGKNLCEVCLYADETKDTSLGSLNFFIEVEPDPLAGGLTSETQIYDLYQQVEAVTEQVIGDDYYDKDDVDALLDDKADKSTTYTKTQVDNLLNDKADKATTYTKTQVDSALALKANSADLATVATTGSYDDLTDKPTIPAAQVQSDWNQADNTKVDYIKNKPYMDDYLTVSQYNDDMSDLNDNLTEEFNTVEEEIIKTTGTEDELPYQTRPTPSSLGNRCLEMLVGGTVAFNQLVQNGNFADGTTKWETNDVSISVSSGVLSITNTGNAGASCKQRNLPFVSGHKYLVSADISSSDLTSCNTMIYDGVSSIYLTNSNLTSTFKHYDGIVVATSTGTNGQLQLFRTLGAITGTVNYKNINIIDLTQMFGSAIADYIYTLESGTAGAGVAWFRNYFTADYYPYTANTLMSVKTSAKKIYDANNTLIETYDLSGSRLVHRRYGVVDLGSLEWNYEPDYNRHGALFSQFVNAPKIPTSSQVPNAISTYQILSSNDGWYYRNTVTAIAFDNTYLHVYNDGTASGSDYKTAMSGVYLVYELATPFDETVSNPELRGIPKLDANNNLYYDGDTCNDFTNPQTVGAYEEFTDVRTIKMPCGHDTIYSKKTEFRYWE